MCHTNEVPAASSSGATDPVALKDVYIPEMLRVVTEGVGGHVADLHFVIVSFKVLKFHPGFQKTNIKF